MCVCMRMCEHPEHPHIPHVPAMVEGWVCHHPYKASSLSPREKERSTPSILSWRATLCHSCLDRAWGWTHPQDVFTGKGFGACWSVSLTAPALLGCTAPHSLTKADAAKADRFLVLSLWLAGERAPFGGMQGLLRRGQADGFGGGDTGAGAPETGSLRQ